MREELVFKNKKGFTLLEVIVVFGISAAIGGLGIFGLVSFRQSVLLRQASREFFTELESARNKAKNSTLSSQKAYGSDILNAKVDAYAIYIDTSANNYSLLYCDESNAGITEYVCATERANLKLNVYNQVNLVPDSSGYCRGILFDAVTGDIKLFDNLSAVNTVNDAVCTIDIQFGTGNLKETIKIDSLNNTISYL